MDVNSSGSDLHEDTSPVVEQAVDQKSKHELHPLHILQQEIAAMPAIDQAKVESALLKIHTGTLDILGTEEQRLASEQRIAAKIIEETMLGGAADPGVIAKD